MLTHHASSIIRSGDNGLGEREEQFAVRGALHAAPVALKQPHAEFTL
jgi:hypothetical protein